MAAATHCPQDDPAGVVHEVMSNWDREAAAKTKQEGGEREDDTPQVDRRHFGSIGSGTEAPLRLDMSTDFFANVSAAPPAPDTKRYNLGALMTMCCSLLQRVS